MKTAFVEDNADRQASLQRHRALTYRAAEAENSEQGLTRIWETHLARFALTMMRPTVDRYALYRALQTAAVLIHVSVSLLTAQADEEGLPDDDFDESFSTMELRAWAENAAEIQRRLQQRFSEDGIAETPNESEAPSVDASFLERLTAIVEVHIRNTNFGVDWLADEAGMSLRQLQRELKRVTHLTPSGFIRTLRLKRAQRLLEQRAGTVSEVAYAVGYTDPKHFAKLFRKVFGVAPSQYLRGRA